MSPLFETPLGTRDRPRLIERLLEEKAYRDYVRGRGGCACRPDIRMPAASSARSRRRSPRALALTASPKSCTRPTSGRRDADLLDARRSMGRGAHPGPLRRACTTSSRARLAGASSATAPRQARDELPGRRRIPVLRRPGAATRALATIIMSGKDPGEGEDPFYKDINLAPRLPAPPARLPAAPLRASGYRALLGAFGANLLFKTGSRPVKRQGEHTSDRGDPARMRAIPNNAILQQFGYVANVVAGLGAAVGSERERFVELAKRSPRLRPLHEMIARAKQLSSLNAMGANAIVFDAGLLGLARRLGPRAEPRSGLQDARDAPAGGRSRRRHQRPRPPSASRRDRAALRCSRRSASKAARFPTTPPRARPPAGDPARVDHAHLHSRRAAAALHADERRLLRADFERRSVLEIPAGRADHAPGIPASRASRDDASEFDERATYRPHGIDDYARIETEILEPMEKAYEFVREIGTGISHHSGRLRIARAPPICPRRARPARKRPICHPGSRSNSGGYPGPV